MKRISHEGIALIAIFIADLVLTIVLVRWYGAREGNPLMAYCLSFGIAAFALAKTIMSGIPLMLLEYARRSRPNFVRNCMRGAICAYLAMYAAGVIQLNYSASDARRQRETREWAEMPITREYLRELDHNPHVHPYPYNGDN